MKAADKDKPIHTIPQGAWEAGMILEENDRRKRKNPNDLTTDSQGNGYPVSKVEQDYRQ